MSRAIGGALDYRKLSPESRESPAQRLLARLDGVQDCGHGRHRAICPAHESKHRTRSLALRELEDRTVLLKCFAGCSAGDIVAAAGMELRDLYSHDHKAPDDARSAQRANHWHAMREAMQTVRVECFVVVVAADNILQGVALTADDVDRVALAAGRIRSAIEACT